VFFILSKVFWWLVQPLHALILMLLLGLVLVALRRRRTGLALAWLSALCMIAIILTPISDLALNELERRIPKAELPAKVTGIVMLGGPERAELTQEYGMVEANEDSERMMQFAALARRYPEAKLVYTGGSGELSQGIVSHGDVMRLFFRDEGLDPARLIIEEKSRNTHENATLTKTLVQPQPGEQWILVTSAFHMPRSLAVFRKAGWDVLPYPVAHLTRKRVPALPESDGLEQFEKLHRAVHEWLGLLAYSLTGRI
jgi:uncharacterized SAM-binding protein YcdF (DUF218 family)